MPKNIFYSEARSQRYSPEEISLVERCAALRCQPLAQFIRSTVLKECRKIMAGKADNERIPSFLRA